MTTSRMSAVAIAPLMDSTTGWRHTESTGRYLKTIRSPHRSITSLKAVRRSIVWPQGQKQMAVSVRCVRE